MLATGLIYDPGCMRSRSDQAGEFSFASEPKAIGAIMLANAGNPVKCGNVEAEAQESYIQKHSRKHASTELTSTAVVCMLHIPPLFILLFGLMNNENGTGWAGMDWDGLGWTGMDWDGLGLNFLDYP
jgi:hypothetical protein